MWRMGLSLLSRLLLVGGLLALIGGAVWGIYHKIEKSGYTRCEAQYEAAQKKGREAHDEKEREIILLPDPDLDSRLLKWMRD